MAGITAAVGKGVCCSKGNFTGDVRTVHAFRMILGPFKGWVKTLTIDGMIGPLTLRPELDPKKWKKLSGTPQPIRRVGYQPVALTSDEVLKRKVGGSERCPGNAYAPTLHDKLVDGLSLGTWKGPKIMTLAFGTDIASKIPGAMINDEEKLAKVSGPLTGKLGKNGWTGKTAVAKVVLMVLQEAVEAC